MSHEEIGVQDEGEVKTEEGEVVMSSGKMDPDTGILMSTRDIEEKRNANKNEDWREQK